MKLNFEGLDDSSKTDLQDIKRRIQNDNEDPLENIYQNIIKILKDIEDNDNILSIEAKDIYANLPESDKEDGGKSFIEFIEFVHSEAVKYNSFNIKERLGNFFDYLSKIDNLKYEYIKGIMEIKCDNLDKGKDIIFFWKKKITEIYIEKIIGESLETKASKNLLLLLEYNYNANQIFNLFSEFKKFICDKNFKQEELFNSFLSTLIAYPDSIPENLEAFISKYYKNEEKILDPKIALDFYLKISGYGKKNNN